ncbi:MAG: carbohydrate-binding protein [Oscillospiraceae bacterium]|nr:carbohydrate-binding protein [Oscillospiraceae bacterium]
MLKRIFASALALFFVVTLLSFPVMAEPFKEITIGEGETVIEAVWFDGGEGNYYESNPEAGNHDIRVDEEVQTYDYNINNDYVGGREGENMSCIGWIEAEEWVQYTVVCETAGMYDLGMWGGTGGNGGDAVFTCGRREIGSVFVENNGEGWQDYAFYPVGQFHMVKGTNVIRVDFPDGGLNFESFLVTFVEAREDPPPIVWVPKNHTIGSGKTRIIGTDFDPGADSYGKSGDPASGDKDLRPEEDVNTQFNDTEFGGCVGWIAAGDWVQYTVTVQRDGIYSFEAWLASDADPTGSVKVSCDGAEIGTSPNSAKDGWQVYASYPVGEAEIVAGEHVIKVEFTNGLNLAALDIARLGDIPSEEEPPPADDKAAEENNDDAAADNDAAENATESKNDSDDGGFDALPFIIIGAVVVVVVVIIIILVANNKGGKKEETKK